MDGAEIERLIDESLTDPGLLAQLRQGSRRAFDRIRSLSARDREALRRLDSLSRFTGFKVDFSDVVHAGSNTDEDDPGCGVVGCASNPIATAGGERLAFDATIGVQFDVNVTFPPTTLTTRRTPPDE
jgi:hypothetical protein